MTPSWLFKELDQEFHFDIDLCATKENSKCDLYCLDYLKDKYNHIDCDVDATANFQDWQKIKDRTCFMNPPYSNPKPFIEKAWEDSKYCKIVALVKCDPSTRWWSTFWDYDLECDDCYGRGELDEERCFLCDGRGKLSGSKPGCEVRFFPKRIKFDPPQSMNLEIIGNKYKVVCDDFEMGSSRNSFLDKSPCMGGGCLRCKGTGWRMANRAGASFPCALVIMDRRGL